MLPTNSTSALEELGEVPPGTSARQLATFDMASCLAAKHAHLVSVVKLWLQDTGCAHDLVWRQEVRHLAHLIKKSDNPIKFTTANGSPPLA